MTFPYRKLNLPSRTHGALGFALHRGYDEEAIRQGEAVAFGRRELRLVAVTMTATLYKNRRADGTLRWKLAADAMSMSPWPQYAIS